MTGRSLSRYVKSGLVAMIVSAVAQAVLMDVCVALSAERAAKGLTSIPTLLTFVGIGLASLDPRNSRRGLQLLVPASAFFLTGLVAYRVGLPYAATGILGATVVALATKAFPDRGGHDTLPSGITNYPRPKLIGDRSEAESLSKMVASMPYSCSLSRPGRSLIRQLRRESEDGKIAVVLRRSEKNGSLATIGSYDPISLGEAESERPTSWESCLACFGFDVQSLSPYTLPATLAVAGAPQVDIPPGLAHGLWAIVCSDPEGRSTKTIAESLWHRGWRVDSPGLGLARKISQLARRRHSPRALIRSQPEESSSHDMVLCICPTPAQPLEGLSGAVILPFREDLRRFLPSNASQLDPSPRPLMILGNGHVLEWREGRWA